MFLSPHHAAVCKPAGLSTKTPADTIVRAATWAITSSHLGLPVSRCLSKPSTRDGTPLFLRSLKFTVPSQPWMKDFGKSPVLCQYLASKVPEPDECPISTKGQVDSGTCRTNARYVSLCRASTPAESQDAFSVSASLCFFSFSVPFVCCRQVGNTLGIFFKRFWVLCVIDLE